MNRDRLRSWIRGLIGAALFGAGLWVLRRELSEHASAIPDAFAAVPLSRIVAALFFTAANYTVLVGFDRLAFRYIGKRLAGWRIALASFVGYAIANNVGFALVSGTSVRYRFYSRWGVGAADLSRIILFYTISFWLGLLALGGWSLAFHPHPVLQQRVPDAVLVLAGWLLLVLPVAYLGAAWLRREPLRVGRFTIALPSGPLALAQLALSIVDWLLAAWVLQVLLPEGGPHFGVVLGVFLGAQLAGLASHVPGGVGVFEGIALLALGRLTSPAHVVSSLILYRVVYYLVPLALALGVLVVDEVRLRRHHLVRAGAVFGGFTVQLAPRILAVFTFLAGVVLLFSGALPSDPDRLRFLDRFLPLGVFEASHFLGSIVGVALLFIAQGVARRLDVAYYLAVVGLALGVAFSLLKAGDFEEATVLSALLLAFVPARGDFDRPAALWAGRFSPGWTIAAIGALVASVWLGFFAYRHVEYANELWWRFELDQTAPRFLRSTVGATVVLLAFGAARLIRPAPPEVVAPTVDDLARAERIIAAQPHTLPNLVFLCDKGLMFGEDGRSFLMYAVQGRTWVTLGDPVGPPEAVPGLIRQFLERADDYDGLPVFYQVRPERLHAYADFGLTAVKLGEEARVDLRELSFEGGAGKTARTILNRMPRDGLFFRVLQPAEVWAAMPQLKAVSDEWLADKRGEKGFSLGSFDPSYLARFQVAVIELQGRIVAFTTLWASADRHELSVDLMRFTADAPKGLMDALFTSMLKWGKEQGYGWFSLGMAPLSGLEAGPLGPTWAKVGHWLFRHGEAFYNFQGLRNYKEKYHPRWEPRYLAYPGGLALPRILADVAALIAGGYRHIFR